jgi:hypothetical protein
VKVINHYGDEALKVHDVCPARMPKLTSENRRLAEACARRVLRVRTDPTATERDHENDYPRESPRYGVRHEVARVE